ncbi:2,3-epoxybenzoyl-CoA dihydrolase [Ilumatobacter sp.]|uniref:2,3-epoxybenzoyl-CoA dihydrolase n=1 Tax=Ilumatobacter sp. TaxID=1967498 RepID=UPI003AF516D6
MADAATEPFVDLATHPDRYRHWALSIDGPVATLALAVDPAGGLRDDYELKMNSYDLGVDIELNDAVQRLRFEHPSVKVVVLTGGVDRMFCAGANIGMLAGSSHAHKVNFCKFTNETRNSIEDATEHSGQAWIAAVNGTAAGGGYELALACDEILLVDDRSSAVSLPEVPLLAVLPGTGGLTRVVEKRHVRRDLADAFATRTEGVRGQTAVDWGLVDAIAPASRFDDLVAERAAARAAASDRPDRADGVELTPLERNVDAESIAYPNVTIAIDRRLGTATFTISAPESPQPATGDELVAAGAHGWLLATARELDDAILHLRFNEPEIGTWVFTSTGSGDAVAAAEAVLAADGDHWLAREIRLYWTRVLKRIDLSARTVVATIVPGSAAVGLLAEPCLAADRTYMLEGTWEDLDEPPPPATIRLTAANLGWFPMSNGLTRLQTRCWGRDDALRAAVDLVGDDLVAADALGAELVTFTPDDLDWEDEVRLMLEERHSFSPDALTGMEANYRFVGPETMETKIFSRLSAWQNWIFQRPNAVGPEGALSRFGTGSRPSYDRKRV